MFIIDVLAIFYRFKIVWIELKLVLVMRLSYNRRKGAVQLFISQQINVFSVGNFLKTGKVKVPSLRSIGKLFQATGPATEKPRPPIVTVLVGGMRRSPAAAERNWEWPAWEESGTQNSDRYAGAASWRNIVVDNIIVLNICERYDLYPFIFHWL